MEPWTVYALMCGAKPFVLVVPGFSFREICRDPSGLRLCFLVCLLSIEFAYTFGKQKTPRMKLCPRLSLRTLAIVVALVGVYFGAWELTKRRGVTAVQRYIEASDRFVASISSPLPFVVFTLEVAEAKDDGKHVTIAFDEIKLVEPLTPGHPKSIGGVFQLSRHSYLCVFGCVYRFDAITPEQVHIDMIESSYPAPEGIEIIKSERQLDGKGP